MRSRRAVTSKKMTGDSIPSCQSPSNTEAENEPTYRIEKVLKRRPDTETGQTEYLIKWLGYDKENDNSWEPEEGLEDIKWWLAEFNRAEDEREKHERLKKTFILVLSDSNTKLDPALPELGGGMDPEVDLAMKKRKLEALNSQGFEDLSPISMKDFNGEDESSQIIVGDLLSLEFPVDSNPEKRLKPDSDSSAEDSQVKAIEPSPTDPDIPSENWVCEDVKPALDERFIVPSSSNQEVERLESLLEEKSNQIELLQSELKSVYDAKHMATEKLTATERKLDTLTFANEQLNIIALQKQSTIDTLVQENEGLEHQIQIDMEQKQDIERDLGDLQTQMGDLEEALNKVRAELDENQNAKGKLTLNYLNLMDDLEEAQSRINELEEENLNLCNIVSDKEEELRDLDTQFKKLEDHHSTMESEYLQSNQEWKEEYARLDDQHEQTKKALKEVGETLAEKEGELQEYIDEQLEKALLLAERNKQKF